MQNERKFEIYSDYQYIKLIIVRFILLGLIFYSIINFNSNKIVVVIVALTLLLLFLSSGIDKLVVYEDRFEHISDSILRLFRKKRVWYYNDMKSIKAMGSFNTFTDILLSSNLWNKIHIEMKSNSTVTINSYIYIDKLKIFSESINKKLSLK